MKKYPRIPHLPGSNLEEDDISSMNFPKGIFYVYEKLDGTNLGISMSSSGDLVFQNRGGFLENKRPHPQWDAAKNWSYSLYENFVSLFSNLPENSVLFGEWLYAKHSIHYTRLESLFVAYDIYVGRDKFLPFPEVKMRITESGFVFSPVITTTDNISEFLMTYMYNPPYSEDFEGYIFRNIKDYSDVYKFVNYNFSAGIKAHWFNSPLTRNLLKV